MSLNKKYYDILKISNDSTYGDIKKAFNKQLLQYDMMHLSDDDNNNLQQLTIAYYVISNQGYRKIYDLYGYDGLLYNDIYVADIDYKKICVDAIKDSYDTETLNTVSCFEKNNIIKITKEISLDIIYSGKYETVTVNRNTLCHLCCGTGSDDGIMRVCRKCQGRRILLGITRSDVNIDTSNSMTKKIRRCEFCDGVGINNKLHKCKLCNGTRMIMEQYEIKFLIPIGITDGEMITIKNEGHINIGNNQRDDVEIRIKYNNDVLIVNSGCETKKYQKFLTKKQCCTMVDHVRNLSISNNLYLMNNMTENDLCTPYEILLIDSLCKNVINIILPDSTLHKLIPSTIIKPDDIIIIDNVGLPIKKNKNVKGKLFVIFQIKFPSNILDDKQIILASILSGE